MYRISLILLILSTTLVSCKKEYTCTCQQTYITTAYTQFGVFHPQSTSSSTFRNTFKAKKADAEQICRNSENLSINTYGTGEAQRTATETVECELY